jgi:eukaryotic-like serine/threonine-protein kinase
VSAFSPERFEIRGRLGAGGMGVVYSAWDKEEQSSVALKTLARLDAATLVQLKREFRTLRDFEHPNVVRLGELFCEAGQWYFSMEHVPGVDFLTWVRPGGVLDEQRLREAFVQLATGIDAIHAAGKLHRDLKPSNVLVTPGGRVVILDFGLAADVTQHQRPDQLLGTPGYMPPEQALGSDVGPWSDWFAAGVILGQALSGQLPHAAGQSATLTASQPASAGASDVDLPSLPESLRDLAALSVALTQANARARPSGSAVLESLGQPPSRRRVKPLLGREAELERLHEAFARASRGASEALVIHGRSGAGKTALVKRFVEQLRGEPRPLVLFGRCSERESVPLKGLDEALDALAAHLSARPGSGRELLSSQLATLDSAAAVAPLLQSLLVEVGAERPIVLVIEDAQWADAESRKLLRVLLAASGLRLLLLCTLRRSPQSDTPLPEFARDLPQLALGELASDAARALAHWSLEGTVPLPREALAASIAEDARGLPRLIETLARAALDRRVRVTARAGKAPAGGRPRGPVAPFRFARPGTPSAVGAFRFVPCGEWVACLWLHTREDPDDALWERNLAEGVRIAGHRMEMLRTLAVTDGGGPNTRQRARLRETVGGARWTVAVVSNALANPLVRGLVTAFTWFLPGVRAFSPAQVRRALAHVDLGDYADPLWDALMEMQAELPRVATLDEIAAVLSRG